MAKFPCLRCGKTIITCPIKYKTRNKIYCSRECHSLSKSEQRVGTGNPRWKGGKPKCSVCEKKLVNYNAKTCLKHRLVRKGKESANWKGGFTKEPITKEYRIWRKKVIERMGNRCIECGSNKRIEIDHIKPKKLYPKLKYEVKNGRPLCRECHKKTKTYAIRDTKLKKMQIEKSWNCDICGKKFGDYRNVRGTISLAGNAINAVWGDVCDSCIKNVLDKFSTEFPRQTPKVKKYAEK